MSEIPVSEQAPDPPLLVRFQDGLIFAVDAVSGLRAWSSKKDRRLVAGIEVIEDKGTDDIFPTSIATDTLGHDKPHHQVVVGFSDGRFSIFELNLEAGQFSRIYTHAASSNGSLSALAYASPYLLTMTESQLLSLYKFPSDLDDRRIIGMPDPPRLVYSLRSHTVWPPLSLSIRPYSHGVYASIAYALPTYLSGWSVGIQEMRLTSDGELIESRIASATSDTYHSLSRNFVLSSLTRSPSLASGHSRLSLDLEASPVYSKPTSLSYSHPYLLVSHPDNTLTLYLVTSTSASLSIGPGSRLWGHTSSVSGAHVGGRGKAVSVSRQGDELRIWELEGGMASLTNRRRLVNGDLSVRIKPGPAGGPSDDISIISDAVSQRGSGLGLALEHRVEELPVARGWVGFDEESVIVLKQKSHRQALVVYDFT